MLKNISKKDFTATNIIIIITILMYIFQINLQNGGLYLGLNMYMLIADFWWQPLSSMFAHGGLAHLGMNMFVLYQFGSLIEMGIDIGIPKFYNQEEFGSGYRIFIGDRTIDLEVEKFKLAQTINNVKTPESSRKYIFVTLFADKNTPLELAWQLLVNINKTGIKQIIYVTRSEGKEMKIYLKLFHQNHLQIALRKRQ